MALFILEKWRPVPGYEGRYEVSNLGRVRSSISKKALKRRIIKATRNKDGYLQLGLHKPGCKARTILLHTLVAQAFVPNLYEKPEVNHKDLNKSNCAAANLEWCTKQENMEHAFANGRKVNGAYQKLTKKLADEIRSKYIPRKVTLKMLALEYGVSESLIHSVVKGETWKGV